MLLALIATIGLCFVAKLVLVDFSPSALLQGMRPGLEVIA